jgi:hypothetical protein
MYLKVIDVRQKLIINQIRFQKKLITEKPWFFENLFFQIQNLI